MFGEDSPTIEKIQRFGPLKSWWYYRIMDGCLQSLNVFSKIKKESSYPELTWNKFRCFFASQTFGTSPSYPETPVGTTWQPTSKPNFVQISLHFLLLFFRSSDWGRFVEQDVGSPGRFWVRKILRKLRWMALDCLNLQANHAPIESTFHHLRQITSCIQTLVDRGACVTWCHCIEKKSLLHFIYISSQMTEKTLPKLQPSTCCIQSSWHDQACQTWLAHSQIE